MILSGGVTVTDKEIEYVNDAVKTGWNENHNSYIKKFEEAFAKYVGAKFARTTSGGTQALTLALAALDIGRGDEVILPDITYFACSDVIKLLGAEPVFVDIYDDTWTINVQDVERAITSRTKAIMPVWLYGNAPEMDDLRTISRRYDIPLVEDACPAVGSFYNQKHAGTFGKFGAFSFHGSKIMTTGFGGMLVTNDEELFHKVLWLADHGEDKSRDYRFWQTGIGYSFDLPNMNCAFGLAQLERIESLVKKKRKIYQWYKKRLSGIAGFDLNEETEGCRTNMWMTSVVFNTPELVDRTAIIKALRASGVDTRPIFFPISDFPMYERQETFNAHFVGYNGINLPSGVNRTEADINFICDTLIEVLGA